MADEDDDLKATVETITAESERLTDVEREKATLEPDDPRMTDLSAEAERLAQRLVPLTAAETDLVAEARPGLTEGDYAERRASWAIQPLSRSSRRRRWLSSYQDSVARFIALGLTSGPRAMTDARTAALTSTAVTFAAMTFGDSPASRAAASMPTGAGERFEHERVGVLGRQEARPGEQERVGRLGRAQAVPEVRPEGDLAPVEPAQRKTEAKAFGEQGKVVGCGRLVHGAAVPSGWRGPGGRSSSDHTGHVWRCGRENDEDFAIEARGGDRRVARRRASRCDTHRRCRTTVPASEPSASSRRQSLPWSCRRDRPRRRAHRRPRRCRPPGRRGPSRARSDRVLRRSPSALPATDQRDPAIAGDAAAAPSDTAALPARPPRRLPRRCRSRTLTGYRWPLPRGRLTLPFGPSPWGSRLVKGKTFHDGIDLATVCGDRIVAAHDGSSSPRGATTTTRSAGWATCPPTTGVSMRSSSGRPCRSS